jgi:hypothetical protein
MIPGHSKTVSLTSDSSRSKSTVLAREHYERMRDFILDSLPDDSEMAFNDLIAKATDEGIVSTLDNSSWYFLKVKQHLQASGVLKVRFTASPARQQVLKINRRKIREKHLHF